MSGHRYINKHASNKRLSCLLLLCCINSAQAQWLYHKPATTFLTGNLGLTYNLNQRFSEDVNQGGGLIGNLQSKTTSSGFIYRPWVLTSKIDLLADLNHNIYNTIDQEIQTHANAFVDGRFGLYPHSDAPTTISIRLGKKAQWGDQSNYFDLGQVRIENIYRPQKQNYDINSQILWNTESESLNQRDFKDIMFNTTLSQQISENSQYHLSLTAQSQRVSARPNLTNESISIVDTNEQVRIKNDRIGIDYSQQWQLSDSGFASLLASFVNEKSQDRTAINDENFGQISSVVYLQSELDSRLSYSASMLASSTDSKQSQIGAQHKTSNKGQSYNANTGFNFDYSKNISFTGDINLNQTNLKSTTFSSFNENLAVQYFDNTMFLKDIDYGWNADLRLSGKQQSGAINSDLGNHLLISPRLGHNIRTGFYLSDQRVSFSISQNLAHQISDVDAVVEPESQWLLQHNGSVSWQHNSSASSTDVSISLADYRHLNDEPRNEQSIYINLQRNTQLNSNSDWGGNMSFEYRQTKSTQSVTTSHKSLSGSLWYQAVDFLDVPRLNYKSTLILPINKLLFNDLSNSNSVTSWQNRLDFRMGLLEATAQMDMTPDSYNISISVRRYFGMPL